MSISAVVSSTVSTAMGVAQHHGALSSGDSASISVPRRANSEIVRIAQAMCTDRSRR